MQDYSNGYVVVVSDTSLLIREENHFTNSQIVRERKCNDDLTVCSPPPLFRSWMYP
jgi:hypothetical protein